MTGHNGSMRGFTLLELLVVIVIIGLLAGYVAPRYFAQAREFSGKHQKLIGANFCTGWLFTYEPNLPGSMPVPPAPAGRSGVSRR